MPKILKNRVANGVYLIEIPEANLKILCGCPADSVKHLMKRGLIVTREINNVNFETGPNAVLLSDVLVQNGSFANLAEFPVLQMLYKQGMIIPDHPNNTGVKPLLMGMSEQVTAQMQYIYRGNYGLISEEELAEAGATPEEVAEMMRMKLKFAFGKISPAEELLDVLVIDREPVQIRNGVMIRRIRLNIFEIKYKNETVTVDLNLAPNESYEAPYPLGFHNIKREYFAIIHSGEGDGWNINSPCMASILMFQGKIYLIDAGPNVLYSLTALGIGVNEIEGIFHTHAHDDHFAGFTTLMRSDHRIKYYTTPLVRASVAKKLSALMSIEEKDLSDYFEVHDLTFDEWKNIDGMEVMPVFSPHPVETSILFFRTLWEDGYKIYAHLADIAAFDILEGMISDGKNDGISRSFYERVKKDYMTRANIKKIDVGGGLIHGKAVDFRDDPSDKIILSHTSSFLTDDEKEIGSGAPFGMVDVLIPTSQDYLHSFARDLLKSYFPSVPNHELNILLNNPFVTFNPESILIKRGIVNEEIYLVLTGNVEMIQSEMGVHNILTAGALIGEISGLDKTPAMGTFRAANFVLALKLPRSLYFRFVKKNRLYADIKRLQSNREFLQNTWLFGEVVSYVIQNKLAHSMRFCHYYKKQIIPREVQSAIYIIKSGKLQRYIGDNVYETLEQGQFFGEECVLFETTSLFRIRAVEESDVFRIPGNLLLDIPVVRWKLFETFQKRMKLIMKSELAGEPPFPWREEYKINVRKIDNQHQAIFSSVNRFFDFQGKNSSPEMIRTALDQVIKSIEYHIREEEELMKKYDYPSMKAHLEKHKEIFILIDKLCKEWKDDEEFIFSSVKEFFRKWIVVDILTEDRKYGYFLNKKNIF